MDNQDAMWKLNQQIFPAPRRSDDTLPNQRFFQACRERPTQSVASQHQAADTLTDQVGTHAQTGDFNFG